MRVIEPSYEILTSINGKEALRTIEYCARTCYQSYEDAMDWLEYNTFRYLDSMDVEYRPIIIRSIEDK